MTVECPYTLQWDYGTPLSLLKFASCKFSWGIWTPSNTYVIRGSLGPPEFSKDLNSNGISIGAAVFAGLTSVTDRPTDRSTDQWQYYNSTWEKCTVVVLPIALACG